MEATGEGDDVPRKQRLAEKLYELAMAGNMNAIEYIANRLDGKPTVALSLAGADSPVLTRRYTTGSGYAARSDATRS